MRMMMGSTDPLRIADNQLKKSLKRLSSAIRINQAGDGPAELAVSQKMRADIVELKMMKRNTKDGISLVQTAEGALTEVHDMLNRMLELSDMAANGTYSAMERDSLQNEANQLKEEIDRIAASANFNGIHLLNGSLKGEPSKNSEPAFTTQTDLAGVTAKPSQQKGAIWKGTVSHSDLRDGKTLTINGVTFEFDTNGALNNANAEQVNFVNNTGAASMTANASNLENAIKSSSLASQLDTCSVTSDGVNGYVIELVQKDAAAKDGKGMSVSSGDSFRLTSHGTPTVVTAIPGIYYWLEIDDIDMDTVGDGTVIEILGRKFELDSDGVAYASGATVLDISGATTATQKAQKIQAAFRADPAISAKGNFTIKPATGGKFKIEFEYNAPEPASAGDIKFNTEVPPAVPQPVVQKNEKGINKPAVTDQNASRTDCVDFSRMQDGSTIKINGKVYEFDEDGETSDPSHVRVKIGPTFSPLDTVAAFKMAFRRSSGGKLTLSTADIDENNVRMTITSTQVQEGETIAIEYEAAPPKEEGGLLLKIGPGQAADMRMYIDGMSAADLDVDKVDISTADQAAAAINVIRQAINKVSSNRGNLGAVHNRLTHTYNSLSVAEENLTDSETRISGADMAEEMTKFTKYQIISQAAQSMLAQSQSLARDSVQQLLQA